MISALFALGLSSFLASTLLPFPSEGALILFIKQYQNPLLALIVGTIMNSLGSLTGYYLGILGKDHLLKRYLKVEAAKAQEFVTKYESFPAIMAFLCFLPVIGDLLAVGLGLVKYSFYKACLFIGLGKLTRYAFVLLSYYYIAE